MCSRLDVYLEAFSTLPGDRDPENWPERTRCRPPHTPLLLLSVLNLIAAGRITRNFIEPSTALVSVYSRYWAWIVGATPGCAPGSTFYRLAACNVWQLVPQPGLNAPWTGEVDSIDHLRRQYLGARFTPEFYPLLQMPNSRRRLQQALMETSFAPEVFPPLADSGPLDHPFQGNGLRRQPRDNGTRRQAARSFPAPAASEAAGAQKAPSS